MEEAVYRARRQMRVGVDPDYDLVHDHFDALHYLLRNRELLTRPDVDLVEHFLEHGEADQLSPHPDFSMLNYLRQHPEWAESGERSPYLWWLKHGKDAGELGDPVPRIDLIAPVLGLTPGEVTERVVARRRDLQQRLKTGRLGEMVAKASELEPLVGAAWPAITRPMLMPLTSPAVVTGMSALHRAHEAAGFRRARVVLVVNQARRDPDLGLEGHLTHALARHIDPSDIVVVYTDASVDDPPPRHPEGVREVDLAKLVAEIPNDEDNPEDEAAQQVLVTLLRTFRADALVNIRSRLLFRSLRTYANALTASERLFLCLSGSTQTAMGTWDGWAGHYVYRTFERLAGLLVDNEFYAGHLIETYQVPPDDRERIHVLPTPVDTDIAVAGEPGRAPDRRPQVFWLGGWGRQRRAGLVLDLARRMPDVDFRLWAPGPPPADLDVPPNVVRGGGAAVSTLPLGEADLWLHTAAWDAVPSSLLHVAMTGVPIVGTSVGGTSEVLGRDDSFPLDEDAAADAYERAIREVLADPEAARRRAGRLRERMLAERDGRAFADRVAGILLRHDESGTERADG
ncbi:hypothetical protein [Nocardioides sp. GXQ0305]|uniref:hypothetical protein n=1 Tax=Nocardioides sp. GXQ0305 TaxID=3423912 RepID=UPI003D7E3B06